MQENRERERERERETRHETCRPQEVEAQQRDAGGDGGRSLALIWVDRRGSSSGILGKVPNLPRIWVSSGGQDILHAFQQSVWERLGKEMNVPFETHDIVQRVRR